jgi:hypothetical protein
MNYLWWTGAALYLFGWLWLVILSYKRGGLLWAILMFIASIPVGLVFCIKKKTGWFQYALMIAGWATCIVIGLKTGVFVIPSMSQ